MRPEFYKVLVTHERAFRVRHHRTWYKDVLSNYPLEEVLKVFTKVLHTIEGNRDTASATRFVLQALVSLSVRKAVEDEAARIEARRGTPVILSHTHLVNFLKDAVRHCTTTGARLVQVDLDLLFRAYLSTHDNFPSHEADAPERGLFSWWEEESLRQSLLGTNEPFQHTLPRYWAIWRYIPRQIGLDTILENYAALAGIAPVTALMLPTLSAWAYWSARTDKFWNTPVLQSGYWSDRPPEVQGVTGDWLDQVSLPVDEMRDSLEKEWIAVPRGQKWEYSFLTVSNWPTVRGKEGLYCLSLVFLMRRATDALYFRMLESCRGEKAKVLEFTSVFGRIFERYAYDLWERLVGPDRLKHILYDTPYGQREAGDGLIEDGSRLFVYDSKSTRFLLDTARGGSSRDLIDDLERGVLAAAQQLHGVVDDLLKGFLRIHLSRRDFTSIYPMVVTATPFPGLEPVTRAIDEGIRRYGILNQPGVAPLQVVDAEGLEFLEGSVTSPSDVLDFFAERAVEPRDRTESVKNLIFLKYGRINPNRRLLNGLVALAECVIGWLETGEFNEPPIEAAIFPPADN